MKITIDLPSKEEIFSKGIFVKIAQAKESWEKSQLGDYADQRGVYIHHANEKILYVGQTTKEGEWGNFAERLRREFQESSSQNSSLYQLLQETKDDNKVVLFPLDEIDKMVQTQGFSCSQERKALLLEQALIAVLEPLGNKK